MAKELTKEELKIKLDKLVAKRANLKTAEKIAKCDAEIVALTEKYEAIGGTLETLTGSEAITENNTEFSPTVLYFPEHFWCKELSLPFSKGSFTCKTEAEREALKKYSVSFEEFSKIL